MAVVGSRVTGTFWFKAVLVLALVTLGDWLFYQETRYGGAFGHFGLALVAAVALGQPAVIRRTSSLVALLVAAGCALAMTIAPSLLAWCLFWLAAAMASLLPRTARFDDGWRWFQRLVVNGLFAIPGPIPDMVRRSRVVTRRRRIGAQTWQRMAALVTLPLLGSAVFGGLFAMANPVIGDWLAGLHLPQIDDSWIGRMVLWLVLAWMAWALLRPYLLRRTIGLIDGSGDLPLPGVSPASVLLSLVVFNALFLVQNAMDAAWLWGLAPMPEGMTLANYAHRGAYPLVATALLAALFVLVALRPGSATADAPAIRRLVALWIGQNMFLLVNAALRTMDYVDAYSLTELRISALLWMGLVALGLALVLWRMLAGKSTAWLLNSNLAAAGSLLFAVCFIDLGAVAAQWNVRHAREVDGNGAQLDLCYLYYQEGSALLPLIELEQRRLEPGLARRVHNVRVMVQADMADRLADGGWDWLTAHRMARAEALLYEKTDITRANREFSCTGEPHLAEVTAAAPAPAPVASDGALTRQAER